MTAGLHDLAATVDCPRKPKGCSSPAGAPCVNWNANREPGEHPPATRIPHPARLIAAQAEVPEQRQLTAAVETGSEREFGDGTPLPEEPEQDDGHWW